MALHELSTNALKHNPRGTQAISWQVLAGDEEPRLRFSKDVSPTSLQSPAQLESTESNLQSPAQLESTESNAPDFPQPETSTSGAATRPHAISPEQPTSEAFLPPVPPAPLHQTPPPAPAAEATGQEAMLPQPAELLRVKSAASIRNGPSGSAKVIGTASTGAEIEVKAREESWVQFVDPSSGNTGWIHSSSVAPSTTAATADSAATQAAEESPPADGPRPKTVKQRPKGAAQIAKKQSPNFSAPTVKGDGRSPKGICRATIRWGVPAAPKAWSARHT
jgi:SH3-like domain-containing protein